MITLSQKTSHRYLRKLMVLPLFAILVGLLAFNYQQRHEPTVSTISNSDTTKPRKQNIQVHVIHGRFKPFSKVVPSSEQLTAWQDAHMYGVWIDGKRINNANLANYRSTDFSHFFISRLSKNAVNYGKHYYQVDLMTNQYYQDYLKHSEGDDRKFITTKMLASDTVPKALGKLEDALILVDGIEKTLNELKTMEPQQIQSITVLKDKAAIEKYGERGRKGVIEIKTLPIPEKPNIIPDTVPPAVLRLKNNDNKVFVKTEKPATYPGGEKAWDTYLAKYVNVDVPLQHKAPKGSYTVAVEFVVEKEGIVSNVRPLTNYGYGMEEELVKVIKEGGTWNPAVQNGIAVNSLKKQVLTFVVTEEANQTRSLIIQSEKFEANQPGNQGTTLTVYADHFKNSTADNQEATAYSRSLSSGNYDTEEFKQWRRQVVSEIKSIAWKEGKAAYVYKGRTYVFGKITNPDPTVASFTEQNGVDHKFLLNGQLVNSVEDINKEYTRNDIKKIGLISTEEAFRRFGIKDAIVWIETSEPQVVTRK